MLKGFIFRFASFTFTCFNFAFILLYLLALSCRLYTSLPTNPPTNPGMLNIAQSNMAVAEGVLATIKIQRLNGTTGNVSVKLSLMDETATVGGVTIHPFINFRTDI